MAPLPAIQPAPSPKVRYAAGSHCSRFGHAQVARDCAGDHGPHRRAPCAATADIFGRGDCTPEPGSEAFDPIGCRLWRLGATTYTTLGRGALRRGNSAANFLVILG